MLALCVISAVCAVALAVLLCMMPAADWPLWKLLLGTLLLVPGHALPLVLLWLAWRHTYFVIPFLGPPMRVGMAAVWWAVAAVALSYTPAVVYAVQGRWPWSWVMLHPYGTARTIGRGWKSHSARHAG